MAKKIVIAGYHGFGNCGDEAILLAMKNNIKTLYPDVELTALSFVPKETEEIYGINSVDRFNVLQVLRALKSNDILISGGGSLLQDETSTRSLLYYLAIIFTAKLFSKKVMLYSNGIGPVKKGISKFLIKGVINKVDLITLREQSSYDELKRLGITKPPIYVTADPAFTLRGCTKQEASDILVAEGIPTDKRFVGVSIRRWKNSAKFVSDISKLCDYMVQKYNVNILLIPMQRKPDTIISEKVRAQMENEAFILRGKYSSDQILGIIGTLELIFSMRLHTLIFAGVQNVPMLGFIYDPKVRSFLELLNMPEAGDISNLDMEKVMKIIDDLFENRDKYSGMLKDKTDVLKEKSNLNDEYLKRLLV